jgi:WXG100 family type VII secretion target
MEMGCLRLYGGVMAKDLRVDPIDLRLSSDHMDMHHMEVSAAHVAANADIEAALAGWVGVSGAALQTKFAEWQEATATITRDIAAHGAAFQNAAEGYATVDGDSSETLDDQL